MSDRYQRLTDARRQLLDAANEIHNITITDLTLAAQFDICDRERRRQQDRANKEAVDCCNAEEALLKANKTIEDQVIEIADLKAALAIAQRAADEARDLTHELMAAADLHAGDCLSLRQEVEQARSMYEGEHEISTVRSALIADLRVALGELIMACDRHDMSMRQLDDAKHALETT